MCFQLIQMNILVLKIKMVVIKLKNKHQFHSYKSKKNLEYILCFEKSKNNLKYKGIKKGSKSDDPITKPQNTFKELSFKKGSINIPRENCTISKGIYGTEKFPNELLDDLIVKDGTNENTVRFKNRFIWLQKKLEEELENGTIINFSKNGVISYKKSNYDEEVPPNLITIFVIHTI